jgi:hypothetical protein
MMEDRARALANWIASIRLQVGDVVALAFVGMTSSTQVRAWDELAGDALTAARSILEAAQADCDVREERSVYEVAHVRGTERLATRPLKLAPGTYDTAKPTVGAAEHLLAEQARAYQAATLEMVRMMAESNAQVLSTMRRENARLGTQNEELAKALFDQRMQVADLIEALKSNEPKAGEGDLAERLIEKTAEHGPKLLELAKPWLEALQTLPQVAEQLRELGALKPRPVVQLAPKAEGS